jgi:hypothetical protein
MVLNWSTQIITSFITIAPFAAGFILMLRHYIKDRYQYAIFHALSWFFAMLMMTSWAVSYLLVYDPVVVNPVSRVFYMIGFYFLIPVVFCFIITIDTLIRETVEPIKPTIMGIIFTVMVFFSLEPSAYDLDYYPNGELGVFMGGPFRVVVIIMYIPVALLFIYWIRKTYLDAPKKLKKPALIAVMGTVIFAIVPIVVIAFRLPLRIPGLVNWLWAIGGLLLAIGFTIQPKLAFILPFKALRLTIIETTSGISLFTHTWTKTKLADDQLFAGMIQAASQFLDESVKGGYIREIQMDQAILILRKSEEYPVVCVLIATSSTHSLRQALDAFSKQFFQEFAPHFKNYTDLTNFEGASTLVADRFSFVPAHED